MRKPIAFFLSIIMLVSLCACGGGGTPQPSPQTTAPAASETPAPTAEPDDAPRTIELERTRQYLYEREGGTDLFTGEYPGVAVAEGDAETYPELAAALEEYSAKAEADALAGRDEMRQWALEMLNESEWFNGFSSELRQGVRRADSAAVSLLNSSYTYTGGVHGNSFFYGVNFDTATGEELKLQDVMPDVSSLPERLDEILTAKYPEGLSVDDVAAAISGNYMADGGAGLAWTLDYQGLTFYFSPYELAPYAAGLLTAYIPFASAPELFNENTPPRRRATPSPSQRGRRWNSIWTATGRRRPSRSTARWRTAAIKT